MKAGQLILLALALIVLSFFVGRLSAPSEVVSGDPIYIDSSTHTVVYIDSSTHTTEVKESTVTNPTWTVYVKDYDTIYIPSPDACDSIREYNPVSSNDSIEITNRVVVHGRLIEFGRPEYKWLKPYKTETTITVTKIVPQTGFKISAGVMHTEAINLGIGIGYQFKGGYALDGSIYTGKTKVLMLSKVVNLNTLFRKDK